MGADTKLYLNPDADVGDIYQALQERFGEKNVAREPVTSYGSLWVQFIFPSKGGGKRRMAVFPRTHMPIGRVTYCSLGSDEEAIEVMRYLAGIFGGLLQENNCGDEKQSRWQEITGRLDPSDGLMYFARQHIMCGGDMKSVVALNEFIHKWNVKIGSNAGRFELYPRETKKKATP